jgi:hypothetical protein
MSDCTGKDESGNGYDREQAWRLLTKWTQSESLRKHALAVEACVSGYRLGATINLNGPGTNLRFCSDQRQ